VEIKKLASFSATVGALTITARLLALASGVNMSKDQKNLNHLPIGVFDSGMGGLTVLRALRTQFPHEDFIYLGDTARLPYGTKSPETVKQYAIQMARVLVERQIKALVIACNTATTAALTHLQMLMPDMPVMGVVAPGALAAVKATRNRQIVVLATETTIASQAYQQLIRASLPEVTLRARACSLLVALAEEGMVNNAIVHETLRHYLAGFSTEDTLVLGCTHFPVFKPTLTLLLPSEVTMVDSGEATAQALQRLLIERELITPSQGARGKVSYLVTDALPRFQSVGELFLGEPLHSADIELIDL
jgi:glutamate racemase